MAVERGDSGGPVGRRVGLDRFHLGGPPFRVPKRTPVAAEGQILCPSDGKVVVIEEVDEPEVFGDKRIQVSIFMSPLNVHAQWAPMAGEVTHANYHPGKYLVAWHPKSSTENERTTLVINGDRGPVLFRQIAGAVARRIRWYIEPGQRVELGEEVGFIKFGSRIDVFLPLGSEIHVGSSEGEGPRDGAGHLARIRGFGLPLVRITLGPNPL